MNPPILVKGNVHLDDRGKIVYCNNCDLTGVRRSYVVSGRRGFVRAYHGHKIESKIVQCLSGEARIVLFPMEGRTNDNPFLFFLSENGDRLLIPEGYYNGLQHLTDDNRLLFMSTTTTEESEGDDYRLPWDSFGRKHWSMENYR